MRIRHAALLMTHSGRTANEAAQDVGFNSYNHFADQFRKQYGFHRGSTARRGSLHEGARLKLSINHTNRKKRLKEHCVESLCTTSMMRC